MNLDDLIIINERLGGGGFATVFVGHLGEMKVAAKKLLQSEREFDNLTREASILRRLRHGKHIAYTYGITLKDENLYMVMEYSEHRDLQNYLKRNKESVTYEQKILFCRGILLGLLYCHSMKIFRNGIKCSDVILGKDLEPKLIDFGLSTTIENIKENNHILYSGSLYWAAPEMFSIKDDETVYRKVIANPYPSDVYSLGATFCEISYDGTTEFIDSDEPDMDIMLGAISPKPKDTFLEEVVDVCCRYERNERVSLDECLSMLDTIAEEQLPAPAIDDKWQEMQQDIQTNSKLELPHSFILHRPKENLVVGPSNLSLLEWLCISDNIEAVEYMFRLHNPRQKQLKWLYSISALCGTQNIARYIQNILPIRIIMSPKLSDLIDLNPWQFIEALVKAGANCDENELLNKAVEGHYNKIVQLYVEKASSYTKTVTHRAIEHKNAEAVRILAGRIDPEFRDKNGDTPLLVAINTENAEIVKILLDLKADVHSKNNRSQYTSRIGGQHTPLYRAAVKGNHEIVKLLINAGATIDTEGSEWHSLVQDLEQQGNSAIIQLISNAIRKEGNRSTVTSISNNRGEGEGSVEATPLYTAIRNRQSDVVQKLIDEGGEANERDYDGYLPLHRAVIVGDKEVVGILLKVGADINAKNTSGETPLYVCVNKSLVDMVQFLAEKGADINTRNEYGCAPIHYAKDREIAEILLAHGADVNTRNTSGVTPLCVCVNKSLVDMVRFLIEKRADISARDKDGYAPIHYVKGREIAEILVVHGADINARNANRITPLFECVDESLIDMVQFLVEKGADVNARSEHGFAPIHSVKNREIAEILISHGADVNAKSANEVTPLFECVNKSLIDMVQFLVEKGADVNARDKDGYAPIHSVKDREIAEILISHGADIDAKNTNGITPLFECVNKSLIDMVQFLIEKGADVNARDKDGHAPIHSVKDREIAEIFITHGADINAKNTNGITPLRVCVNKSLVDMVQLLIEKGADVNTRDKNGHAPIHYVKDREIAEILVTNGADINAKGTSGLTPLFACVEKSLVDMVQFLIEKGADINVRGKYGYAPIHYVKDREIAEILIACGANINAKNNDGKTLFNILLEVQNKNLDNAAYSRREVSKLLEYLKNLQ